MSFPYVVSDELRQTYQRDGYLVTADVFDAAELAKYGAFIDTEVAQRTATDHREVAEKSTYEQSLIQCMRLWETNAGIAPLTCDARLAGIAAQLMGVAGVRLWQDQALYKEAGGRETTPHQDQTFWPIGDEPLVSAWIPLQDVRIADGAMAYVPGSHLAGRLQVVDITHTTDPYDILKDPALNGAQPNYVEVSAGSVIWHHGLTVHQAAANTSSDTRRAFTVVYISDQARRHKAWPTFPLDRDEVEVGGLIEGSGMPRLWPAPTCIPIPPASKGETTGPQMRDTTDQ